MPLWTKVLLAFARDPAEPEIGATVSYTIDNCLDYARKTIPSFDEQVRNRTVLDYGCGPGFQAVAMVSRCGAKRAFGLDVVTDWFANGRKLAEENHCADRVSFGDRIPAELDGKFDAVLSLSAFEHYSDPARELRTMRDQLLPGGVILLSFAEPWWSHSGSHIGNYTRIPFTNAAVPWVNLFFSDQALLDLRARFRPDHPTRLCDISGGLNKMTVRRFEQLVAAMPEMRVEYLRLHSVKRVPLVTRVPVLRELMTGALTCILKPAVKAWRISKEAAAICS